MSEDEGSQSEGGNVYQLPLGQAGHPSRHKADPGVPGGHDVTKPRTGKRRRLSKTAAGLALIVGTGGGVAAINGADSIASARATPGVSAARVVDIAQLGSARRNLLPRRTPNTRKSPVTKAHEDGDGEGPDGDGPSAA
jgi:hypothetical protein